MASPAVVCCCRKAAHKLSCKETSPEKQSSQIVNFRTFLVHCMKVHLIKKQSIEDYVAANSAARIPFSLWLTAIKGADWSTAGNMKETFGAADLLGNGSDRVVFNIGGNHYRMICHYVFARERVRLYICWIGKHAAYDKLCKKGEQYTVNAF